MKQNLNATIIGAGGVTSYLLPALKRSFNLNVVLIDGDKLETSLRSLLSKREKEQAVTQQLHQDFDSLQVDFEQKRMESVNLRKELIKSEGRV